MDKTDFMEIYEVSFRRVYNYISYRINDHDDVEDLVSQVFMRAMEKYPTFVAARGQIEGWIIGIARNTVVDYFRARAKRQTTDIAPLENHLPCQDDRPDEIIVRNEDHRRLMEALDKLTGKERNVIALKYGAQLNNRQIARQLGLTVSNTGVILFRSLRKLGALMREEVWP